MKKFTKENFNTNDVLNELMQESGVIVFENVYNLDDIKSAREIVNHFADTQEQKESHFNAEAEASGTNIRFKAKYFTAFKLTTNGYGQRFCT